MEIQLAKLITIFFLLVGPLKAFAIYGNAATHADKSLRFYIANASVALATFVALLLALAGGFLMSQFDLSMGTLKIVVAIFLAHWAWGRAMGIPSPQEVVPNPEAPTKALAIIPVAFPGILPPQGIALLVLTSTMAIEAGGLVQSNLLIVIKMIVGVMVLNWIFFLSFWALMKFPGPVFWMLLSRSLGVVGFGLSLQIALNGMRDLGILG